MTTKRPPRDQRYRDKCFPGAAKEVFSPEGGGYAPLPYVSRLRGTGLETKGTVSKAVNRLEKIGLVRVFNDRGTRRYLLRDPRLAVER
jgi:hypothetical protein